MPNRILKESICTSEDIAMLSPGAEVLFYRLIVKADDFGLYYANPKIIIGSCLPLKPPTVEQVLAWLDELCAAGLVIVYTGNDGRRYLKLASWDRHQQRRADKSKFPQPSYVNPKKMQENESISEQMPATADETENVITNDFNCEQVQANVPVFVNENVNDKRDKRTKKNPPNPPQGGEDAVDLSFERFWDAYPKKADKDEAKKAWKKLRPGTDTVAAILAGVERWKVSRSWTKDNGEYICYPATFLRRRRWETTCFDVPSIRAPDGVKNYDEGKDFFSEE